MELTLEEVAELHAKCAAHSMLLKAILHGLGAQPSLDRSVKTLLDLLAHPPEHGLWMESYPQFIRQELSAVLGEARFQQIEQMPPAK